MQQDDPPQAPQPGAASTWSGRFSEPLDALARRFNASVY